MEESVKAPKEEMVQRKENGWIAAFKFVPLLIFAVAVIVFKLDLLLAAPISTFSAVAVYMILYKANFEGAFEQCLKSVKNIVLIFFKRFYPNINMVLLLAEQPAKPQAPQLAPGRTSSSSSLRGSSSTAKTLEAAARIRPTAMATTRSKITVREKVRTRVRISPTEACLQIRTKCRHSLML